DDLARDLGAGGRHELAQLLQVRGDIGVRRLDRRHHGPLAGLNDMKWSRFRHSWDTHHGDTETRRKTVTGYAESCLILLKVFRSERLFSVSPCLRGSKTEVQDRARSRRATA